jgi:hypothetical protein
MSEAAAGHLPFFLRANDVQKHILNVDSCFRDDPRESTADFYFTLPAPIRNALRVRLTSIEFPDQFAAFTARRRNISVRILWRSTDISDQILSASLVLPEDGNYTGPQMADTLQEIIDNSVDLSGFTVSWSDITHKFTFTWDRLFGLDTTYESWDRSCDYGLGWHLGFPRGTTKASASLDISDTWILVSPCMARLEPAPYILLRINDYRCVKHRILQHGTRGSEAELDVFAKFVLRRKTDGYYFDDYASDHVKETVFTVPEDVRRLRVELLDRWGVAYDLCKMNWSFSLEVLEIKNIKLYNSVRDSLSLPYRPVGTQESGAGATVKPWEETGMI